MNTKELLEIGSQRVVEINKLMLELERHETVMSDVKFGNVSISHNGCTTYLTDVLPEEKMQELKGLVMTAIYNAGYDKISRYKELIGVKEEKKKPAVINPEFEKAILDMKEQQTEKTLVVDSGTAKCVVVQKDKQELTVELVKELYIDQDLSIARTGEALGVDKNKVYRFIKANKINKPSKKERELYRDAKVESAKQGKG